MKWNKVQVLIMESSGVFKRFRVLYIYDIFNVTAD